MKRKVGLVGRRKLLNRLVSAAVALGEAVELQKSNTQQRQQLAFILQRLRKDQTDPRTPDEARKLVRSHIRIVSRDRRYLDGDRRKLGAKAKRLREAINLASARLLNPD